MIGLPEVAIAMSGLISGRNLIPKLAASCFTAIANDEGNDLTRLAAERNPDPSFAAFLEHEGPQFVEFQFDGL